jgi:nuclear cap-binding protein subunit 1
MDAIQEQAAALGVSDPLIPSTDAYVTAVCYIGSKSLSHVLSCIERCKERLQSIGPQSEAARRQIVKSVVEYWKDQPGTAVNIVDKLLNYSVLTPESVILWALGAETLGSGRCLSEGWRYEMVAVTVGKVTNRVRQVVAHRISAVHTELPEDQIKEVEDTLAKERPAMRQLFASIEDSVSSMATGSADGYLEADGLTTEDAQLIRQWGERWARVFRRKLAVEEAFVSEAAVAAQLEGAIAQAATAKIKAAEAKAKAEAEAAARAEAEAEAAAAAAAQAAENGNGHDDANMDEGDVDEV